jgi:hypothetical protein
MYKGDTVDLRIDHVTQLFLDNLLIESVQDLTRRMHQPRKVEGGPFLTADQPWELVSYFSCNTDNVLWDPQERLFKCWYTDWQFNPTEFGLRPVSFHNPRVMRFRLLYAYSSDGIHWTKPALGLVREGGRDTNVVLGADEYGSFWSGTVFIDPFATDPARRFKLVYDRVFTSGAFGDETATATRENRLASSPDGIHWTVEEQTLRCGERGQLFDDVIVMTTDPAARQYVAFTRHAHRGSAAANPRTPRTGSFIGPFYPNDPSRASLRRVWAAESSDLFNWTEPYLVLRPDDEEDSLDDGFYGLVPLKVGSHYVGLLNVLHGVENTMDVQLVHSRDRRAWQRAGKRQPFLPRGAPGSWDETMVTVESIPIPMGDELWIFYGGAKNHHDWWFQGTLERLDVPEAKDLAAVRYGLGLAKLRRDGFVSLQALPVREGILVTKPVISDGTQLVINAACGPKGYVDIEVTDVADELLPGFSRAECDRFTGDRIRHVVAWQGRTDIPALAPVENRQFSTRRLGWPFAPAGHRKLRFYLRDAHLYSFAFERPSLA